MKFIVSPATKQIEEYEKKGAYALLFGLKDFSTGYQITLNIEELKDLKKENKTRKIFVDINKMIFDDEMPRLKEELKKLDELNLEGIMFYDLCFMRLKDTIGLKTPLVWNQTHMVTNYNTCNYYVNKGISMAVVSNEITLEEILEIKKFSSINLFVLLCGYPIMAHSKRKLLTNYFSYIQKDKEEASYETKETDQLASLKVQEDQTGTSIYYNKIRNGIKPYFELQKHNIPYGILKEDGICHTTFLEILSIYQTIEKDPEKEKHKENYIEELTKRLKSDDTGFFYKKTIYRVKKDEK